ncbi:MAG: hypothetical protein JO019_01350 [Candidatus Kaiserbacteria bacterium]|nr:hypothetical protein [Candidatus Kaiserbacteria bacterium]
MAILNLGRERVSAIFDIDPGHVGCAIVAHRAGAPATVIAEARSALNLEPRTGEQAAARVTEEIAAAAKSAHDLALERRKGIAVQSVYCMIRFPHSSSTLSRARKTFEKETFIRDAEIAALAQEARAKAAVEKPYESAVVSILLNGYLTHAPEGKYAHDLELVSLFSSAEEGLLAAVRGAAEKSFPAAKSEIRSSARMRAVAIGKRKGIRDALLIDCGVGGTDIVLFCDGIADECAGMDEGLGHVLAAVSKRPPEEIASRLRMIARGAGEDEASQAIDKALAAAEPGLVKLFGEKFAALAQRAKLPHDLILVAHPDMIEWLTRFFSRIDFTQFTRTSLPFAVESMQATDFAQFVIADESDDAALAAGCAALAIEEQST